MTKQENRIEMIIYLIILWIIIRYDFFKNQHIKAIEQFEITDKEKNNLYELLKILTDKLDSVGIVYWIDGGTILGSIRHGCLVPWDDDIDICILESDFNKLNQLSKSLNKEGFEIVKHWYLYKFRYINQEYPFIDIFLNIKKDNKYTLNHKKLNETWPNEYFTEKELFPLKKYKFGSYYYSGPNYCLDYLDRMYPFWEFIGIQTYDHKEKKKIKYEIELNPDNKELKLKPYYLVKNNENPFEIFNKYFNEYIIVIDGSNKKIKLELNRKINLN